MSDLPLPRLEKPVSYPDYVYVGHLLVFASKQDDEGEYKSPELGYQCDNVCFPHNWPVNCNDVTKSFGDSTKDSSLERVRSLTASRDCVHIRLK